jgi:hypothetical protein
MGEAAAAYLAAVRGELADLTPEEREDLLADVEISLVEAVDESRAVIETRLGRPADFAAELRAAAGLPGRRSAPSADESPRIGLLDALRRLAADRRVRSAVAGGRELAPIWWLARAYLVAAALVLVGVASWATTRPEVPVFNGDQTLTLLVLGALAGGSVSLGLRARRAPWRGRSRQAAIAGNVALAVFAVPVTAYVLSEAPDSSSLPPIHQIFEAPAGLANGGVPVRNVYAFGRDGRPLFDVLLYDDRGEPLDVGGPAVEDPLRRVVRTRTGRRLYNSYPIRYFDSRMGVVRHPRTRPLKRAPRVVTRPLRGTQG